MKTSHVLLLIALAAPAASAQRPATPPPAPTTPPAQAPLPDIEFAADVHMDSIRFSSDPQAHVAFDSGPRASDRHDVDRGTLPTPVRPGVTYRDVTVRTTISTTLFDPSADAPAPESAPTPEEAP